MVDVRLLLQFSAVARTLSFTEAARELGVAQPWLSARIRKLEDLLGFRLFQRSTRHVALTPEGMELAEQVRPFADAASRLLLDVEYMRDTARSRLRIGLNQMGTADQRQYDLIKEFSRRYPGIALETEPGSPDVHLERLSRGLLDLALTLRPVNSDDWEAISLHQLWLAVVMKADDDLAHVKPLTTAYLAGRRVATFARIRSPQIYDIIYGPVVAAGARTVVMSDPDATSFTGMDDLLTTLLVPSDRAAKLGGGLFRRAVTDVPSLPLQLVRRRGVAVSRPANLFWQMALLAGCTETPVDELRESFD